MDPKPILVTGATGYVGGRLLPALLDAGYRVRAMGRSLAKLADRPWAAHPRIELVQGDVMAPASLTKAAAGCGAAYYLVHSMITQKARFVEADRRAARHMVDAAAHAGLERMIYLGGLAEARQTPLSKHLQSRLEVARILQAGPVPTTELRAPMILGSGSASFEILRYLVERLPAMVTPQWVHSLNQPIAIRNVIQYLVGCLEKAETIGQSFDIGGPDVITYRELLEIYAQEARLRKRLIIPVPVLTPTLSAYWIHLISPVPTAICPAPDPGADQQCGLRRKPDSRHHSTAAPDLPGGYPSGPGTGPSGAGGHLLDGCRRPKGAGMDSPRRCRLGRRHRDAVRLPDPHPGPA